MAQSQPIGFRINPLVGAGKIAALSVSTSDSKFGVPITEKKALLEVYLQNSWLTSLHVHVGSGGMGAEILAAGIRVAVDLANEVNANRKGQIHTIDIGGGLPVNYASDEWAFDKIPTFLQYAQHLREKIPELFSGDFKVVTEFGQSFWAKCGFLASRIEFWKPEQRIAVVHFGADCCPRQAYTAEHKRRIEAYTSDGEEFGATEKRVQTKIAGPLCFQGDFVSKDALLPAGLNEGDIVVLKDAGANTLSMFSRHCSRLCPPVWGYRWAGSGGIGEMVLLKDREALDELYGFWAGGTV